MKGIIRLESIRPSSFQTIASGIVSIAATQGAWADWKDDVGFTRLQSLASAELPTVVTKGVAQIEASEAGNFIPDTSLPRFAGKTFAFPGGTSSAGGHATNVGTFFYGNPGSMLPGSFEVDCYSASPWMASGFLNQGNIMAAPKTETRAVQNHSWIAKNLTSVSAEDAIKRLDFAINRDGFSSVVGVDNGSESELPQLWCQSYHTISVGRTDGNHSAGFTTLDGTGRVKPEIVGPHDATSWATPMVAGAAGLLHEKLSAAPHSLTGANLPRVTKALLLATATKEQFPAGWSNTTTRPLDLRYGAGQLNVHHAWQAMRGGNLAASGSTVHPSRGWSAESIPANGSRTWFITVPTGGIPTPFSAALTWHRIITTGVGLGFAGVTASLPNLNLRLHEASGFTVGTMITESVSTVDNLELVNQSALPAGTYALVVENTAATAVTAALAWHSLPAVTVAATDDTAEESDGSPALVTFTRSGDTSLPLFVPITPGGTAVSGIHFTALPSSVTIPAGSSSVTLTVAPVSDGIAQGDRTLTLVPSADFALVRDAAQPATITIKDKPFDAWRFANFDAAGLANPLISSATADPDHDSLPNLIEYALGLDPELSSANPVAITTIDDHLQLTATKNPGATDITWAAEASGDLETWVEAEVLEDTSSTFTAKDPVATDEAEKRFMRLKVVR